MPGSDLFTGTLDLLILRTVAAGPAHGYGIGVALRDTSNGVVDVAEGVLYPALHRLEESGLLEHEWARTDSGRRAKFYALTDLGEERLKQATRRWERLSNAVRAVLDMPGEPA
jgi:PadR family transcriptional regulator PadR